MRLSKHRSSRDDSARGGRRHSIVPNGQDRWSEHSFNVLSGALFTIGHPLLDQDASGAEINGNQTLRPTLSERTGVSRYDYNTTDVLRVMERPRRFPEPTQRRLPGKVQVTN